MLWDLLVCSDGVPRGSGEFRIRFRAFWKFWLRLEFFCCWCLRTCGNGLAGAMVAEATLKSQKRKSAGWEGIAEAEDRAQKRLRRSGPTRAEARPHVQSLASQKRLWLAKLFSQKRYFFPQKRRSQMRSLVHRCGNRWGRTLNSRVRHFHPFSYFGARVVRFWRRNFHTT